MEALEPEREQDDVYSGFPLWSTPLDISRRLPFLNDFITHKDIWILVPPLEELKPPYSACVLRLGLR